MYIKNNSGPKTDPCGTPLSTLPQIDAFSIDVHALSPAR